MASHEPAGLSDVSAPSALNPELTRWQKFRLVVKVVELRLRFIALLAVTALVFAYWDTIWNYYEKWTRPATERVGSVSEFEYYCPMHPTVVQTAAGSCPICGMPLSKRQRGHEESLPAGVLSRVTLSPDRVAQAGVETVEVVYQPLVEQVTTVGQVTFDERSFARISSKTRGLARVEKLFVNFTGTTVRAGEPLAELYSPELYQAIRELLLAQEASRRGARLQSTTARSIFEGGDLVALAREKLALWGITSKQIDEILASGKPDFRMQIVSPIGGHVIKKNVVEGQYVSEGEAMFEVADLSTVWVKAQVYEDQVSLVRVGLEAEAIVEAFPGEVFAGKVAFVQPHLETATRTVEVRYDMQNPGHRLRPGMFAKVTFRTPIAQTPLFRARLAAHPLQDATEFTSLTVHDQGICPVTNLKLGSMGEPASIEITGKRIWMCCPACEEKLRAAPSRYLAKLMPPPKDAVLVVPELAVIDTGTRKVVFVETEGGVYEAREVVVGPLAGGVYPLLEGLTAGDRVVAAGSFLLDAETRLKASSNVSLPPAAPPPEATGPMATKSATPAPPRPD
jgi:Cu(I)/Ag(I) efflux system membrane fusion protein